MTPGVLFLNSIKVSFRKMRRQKWYSLITVTGLAAGMAYSILILLWVRHKLSYDRFHTRVEDVYRVIMDDHLSDSVRVHPWLPFPLGPALKDGFPEIAAVSCYRPDDMVVRYKDESHTETRFLTVDPGFPCEYEFLDEAFGRMYTNERRLSSILLPFAALAVFISCLGLVGLSFYLAEEKSKEIGIRKVLGASSWRIISFFSMDFAKLVVIANVIAWPVAYAVMHGWLEDYACRTPLQPWLFLMAGGLGLGIAFLSVGYQTFRAAMANPANSLRYE